MKTAKPIRLYSPMGVAITVDKDEVKYWVSQGYTRTLSVEEPEGETDEQPETEEPEEPADGEEGEDTDPATETEGKPESEPEVKKPARSRKRA